MDKIFSFQEMQEHIKWVKDFKKGFITNFFPDPFKISLWIHHNLLFQLKIGETIFFLRKNDGFISLFYVTTTLTALDESLILLLKKEDKEVFVLDLVGNESISTIKNLFFAKGFKQQTSLIRMSRLNSSNDCVSLSTQYLYEANSEDARSILDLFNLYFDPYSEQIPLKEEIEKWIETAHILVYKDKGRIVGFIIYDLSGVTLYLRYWFVHPDYREQKIGSALFNNFLYKGKNTKRQLFWVIESNENAIKRYIHYGFFFEKMFDYVLIKK